MDIHHSNISCPSHSLGWLTMGFRWLNTIHYPYLPISQCHTLSSSRGSCHRVAVRVGCWRQCPAVSLGESSRQKAKMLEENLRLWKWLKHQKSWLKTRRNGNLTNQTADFMGNHRDIMEIFHGDMEKSSGLSRGKRWEIPEPNGDSSISRLDYQMLWVYLKIRVILASAFVDQWSTTEYGYIRSFKFPGWNDHVKHYTIIWNHIKGIKGLLDHINSNKVI